MLLSIYGYVNNVHLNSVLPIM